MRVSLRTFALAWWAGASALAFWGCATLPRTGATPALGSPSRWIVASPGVTMVPQQGRLDCGSAALAMVLEHHDPANTPVLVRQLVGQGDGKTGVAASRLRDVARVRGLDAFVVEGTFADLVSELRQGRPVLVGVQRIILGTPYAHFMVVAGIDPQDQQILTADPAHGWTQESFAEFKERWEPAHHLTLVVMPKAMAQSGN